MTVQELIDELNKQADKNREIFLEDFNCNADNDITGLYEQDGKLYIAAQ